MYVEASYPRVKGDITKIRSPTFPMSGYDCTMQIAYHMRGLHIGTLAVEVQAAGGTEVRVIWEHSLRFRIIRVRFGRMKEPIMKVII